MDDSHIVAQLIKAYFRDLESPLFPDDAWFVGRVVVMIGAPN